ncbi:MAG: DNA topoisomerase IV subunit B, partial [Clostridia bacterium]|nr:DNA topoisomerase IV subunit B [Clostridia bacterium]
SYEDENGEIHSGVPVAPLKKVGKTNRKGTVVRFMPDARVFESTTFVTETIAKHMQDDAFMYKGAHFVLIDKRKVDDDMNPYRVEFCYEGGIVDLVKFINESKVKLFKDVIYIEDHTREDCQLEVAIQYTDDYSETIASYVNNIPTADGGTHETGFKSALTRVLNDYARMRNILKEKDANFQGEDFREGICCVLSLKMKQVQFEGQTKGKLGSTDARIYVEGIVCDQLEAYLNDKRNWPVGDAIIDKAMTAQKARVASKKAKEIARQKSNAAQSNLIGKLAPATGRKPELNEIFIVEGDSAGGTAKQCRNRATQAILPLRGKIINAEKKRIDQLLDNEEICMMIAAFGAGFGEEFNVDNLKYHKVIILADADQDGGHIRCLLITFFYRYMKELITAGHVYCGMPPLYRVSKKDQVKYVYSDRELDAAIREIGRGYSLQRYKGLGEMSKEQLWETTMDPERRSLMKVTLEDGAMAEKMISTLMGENIDARKEYISIHADFNKVDDFQKKE